jgi:hypothetical protein
MADTKVIKNNTSTAQSVVYGGRQIIIKGYAEERMDAALADVFLTKCSPIVEEVFQTHLNAIDSDTDEVIWIANVTGHPDYPKEVQSKYLKAKRWESASVPNPSAYWFIVQREYDPGQQAYTGRDGSYLTKNLPKIPINIRPFQRKAFKKDIGGWFLRREGNSVAMSGYSPSCIKSRAPTAYEPDMSWHLDEIRAYLQIASSGEAKLPVSEKELAELAKASGFTGPQIADELNKAKKQAVETVWYYVADPKFKLPTRMEVREFLAGKSAVEVIDEQVDRIMDMATA